MSDLVHLVDVLRIWHEWRQTLPKDRPFFHSHGIQFVQKLDDLLAISASGAGVDPSQDLATAFAETFPQQDLPADAAKVFLENYSTLLNEDPTAGVDRQARIAELEAAIRWALGEIGDFGEEPEPLLGKYRQRYWWRTELRQRAKLAGVEVAPPPAEKPL